MTAIPADAQSYKTTKAFTPDTVPNALLAMHRTKPGIWGRIDVLDGGLAVSRFDPDGAPVANEIVQAGDHAIVEPEEPHAVSFAKAGRFTVTFFKVA